MTDEALSNGFKQAMRRLATTVALITSGKGDNWAGMAATAVVSVCAEPPTILVAVNRSASLYPTLHAEQRFCVNLLSERHKDLVGIFSGKKKGRERFEDGAWTAGECGLPILSDALSALMCKTVSTVDVGTHTLFIGEVESIENHMDIDPLIWVDGGMASAAR
ncbi:flavin reductase [Sphingomonas crocodyli]|uniref:Flavin reductase n=1 Tax=Sphingomonas crocodyli TaxID=1979270 RepID=A0A437M0T6_9SPHN|nr:flavin reductase [Sphingomonas crocodyli]